MIEPTSEPIFVTDFVIPSFDLITCTKCKTNMPLISLYASSTIIYIEIKCNKCISSSTMTLNEYLQLIKQEEPVYYCNCKEEEPKHSAKHYCVTCQNWLCQNCVETHKRIERFQNDFILTKEIRIENECKAHNQKRIFEYYCKECKVPICKKCLKKLHSNHPVMNFNVATTAIQNRNLIDVIKSFKDIRLKNKYNTEDLIKGLEKEIDSLNDLKQRLSIAYENNDKNNAMIEDLFTIAQFNFEQLNKQSIYELFINMQTNFTVNNTMLKVDGDMKAKCLQCIDYLNTNFIVRMKYEMQSQYKIQAHTDIIHCLTQLNDGRLASGSKDKTIKIFNIIKDKCEETLKGHESGVYSLLQLKDHRLISGSFCEVKVWSLYNWKCLATLTEHTNSIFSLIQLKDMRLLSASGDKTIRVWDVLSLKCSQALTQHENVVYTLIELKDGRVASGSWDRTIRLWSEMKCVGVLIDNDNDNNPNVLLQLIDGRLVSGSANKLVLWDINSIIKLGVIEGTQYNILSLMQLESGVLLSGDCNIIIWNINHTIPIMKQIKNESCIRKLIELDDGRIASCSDNGVINLWSL